ncbi:MAG: glycosyltransferase family 2 protein [Alphaproteobacteria bacterium]|nr:glycosyltransferase family 2 protein [Alphaproteobacteria bacterium]
MQTNKELAHSKKLLVFIVAYNASAHIEQVFERIPDSVWGKKICNCDVLVIDDCSQDDTAQIAVAYAARTGRQITVQRNTVNKGYGGNQKLGYQYALDRAYDLVILLHGDGQYAPEYIPILAQPVLADEADVVIGSRMMQGTAALKGGMPLYKFIGNIVVTTLQNLLLGVRLSEFHSGYRVYATSALQAVPFQANADYFDFDTDILIQMIDTGQRFKEISIPTFYGSEICHVNGPKYVIKVLATTILSRLQRMKLWKSKKFEYRDLAVHSLKERGH